MSLRLDHVAIDARDLRAMAEFYAVAGFAANEDSNGIVWLDGSKGRIALYPSDGPAEPQVRACDPGIAHLCIQTRDPHALWQRFADAGMDWNAEPLGLGTGYLYAYGYDIEGNLVELEGTDEGTGAWLAHAALVTADIGRLSNFYADLTQIPVHASGTFNHPNMGTIAALEGVENRAAWIQPGAVGLEFWQYLMPPTRADTPRRRGYRHLGFAGGVAAHSGTDPDGNHFVVGT